MPGRTSRRCRRERRKGKPVAPESWPRLLKKAYRKSRGSWNCWYRRYIKSAVWKERRTAALERAEGKCLLCGATERLEVHHVDYTRVGCEEERDLRVLCKACHKVQHGQSKMIGTLPMDAATRKIVREKAEAKYNAPPPVIAKQGIRRRPRVEEAA